MVQNAGIDATQQFEDINHSEKAHKLMEDMFIGDFKNPDGDNETFEEYWKRKGKE